MTLRFLLLLVFVLPAAAQAQDCKWARTYASMQSQQDQDRALAIIEPSNSSARQLITSDAQCKIEPIAEFHDYPISIFYLSDNLDIFGTLWSSGTSLIFRVFSEKTKKMVFEAYEKHPPRIFWVEGMQYPVFQMSSCKNCKTSSYFTMEGESSYRKATAKEAKLIKKKLISDISNAR